MELIRPQKQRVWKWPAVANFTMGGMGTGLYVAAWFANSPEQSDWLTLFFTGNSNWLTLALQAAAFKLLAPALVALGFIALTTEAGKPQRGINLFRHLRRSWMSRETLAFALFAPLAGLDWLMPNPLVRALAVIAALLLMFSQGMIPYRARGVTAWNVALVPISFMTAGLATGGGLELILRALFGMASAPATQTFVTIALLANLAAWLVYINRPNPAFQSATRALREPQYSLVTIGVGHLLPALGLLGSLAGLASSPILLALVGALVIFGGAMQKWGIVIDAGYLRAIVLSVAKNYGQRPEAAK